VLEELVLQDGPKVTRPRAANAALEPRSDTLGSRGIQSATTALAAGSRDLGERPAS